MRFGGAGILRDLGLAIATALPLVALMSLPVVGLRLEQSVYRIWLAGALVLLVVGWGLTARSRIRERRLLAGVLVALREGDYSTRIRTGSRVPGELARTFNALAERLGGEARHGVESDALLSQLLASLELAVLIVDEHNRLVEINPAAEAVLGNTALELAGRDAISLGLSDWLSGDTPFIDRSGTALGKGPWEVRRVTFRRRGRCHRLVVVTDVSRALREEERRAWRNLLRVLGHEINNSLGSIQSTAGLLKERVAEGDEAFSEGLDLIERRSRTLGGFIRRYADLAGLPPPTPTATELSRLVRHIATLETEVHVVIESRAPVTVYVDRSQFEQAMINLVRNAVEAALETGGGVRVRWREDGRYVQIEVEDDGPGIARTDNLFVPFFTTKPCGSGIGLVLARQVIEAHGGSLSLGNRANKTGVIVTIRLPIFRSG